MKAGNASMDYDRNLEFPTQPDTRGEQAALLLRIWTMTRPEIFAAIADDDDDARYYESINDQRAAASG